MNQLAKKATFQKYPNYKDSGVEWVGEIPEGWTIERLGTFLRPVSIKGQPELPLLSITRELGVIERDLDDEDSNHNYIPDDLSGYKVIKQGQLGMNKMKAWQGSYGVSPITGIVSPAYFVFGFTRRFDLNYFHKAIRSKKYVDFFGQASDGVRIGQWDLSKSRMKEIPFFIPPLQEQTAIAQFLDDKTAKIDRAIAQKEKMIALLKERKQIIIQNAVTKGIDPNVKLKDSGVEWIGEIPEEWEVKRLKNICKTYGRIGFRGYSTSDLVNKGEGAITISPSNIQGDLMSFDKCTYLSWKKYHESPEIKIFKNDVLIVKTGSTFGKVGYASNLESPATINPQLLVFKDVAIDNEYFYEILNSSQIQIQINKEVIGSTIPTISEHKILNMKAGFPPNTKIPNIVERVKYVKNKFNEAIASQIKQIEKLNEYKATLIDSAVTGKIKVI